MFQKEIVINNKTGLHARPATLLVELSSKFESEIVLRKDGEDFYGKSIISILSGGIYKGTKIQLKVTGPDEAKAGPQVAHFLETLTD
ncbi:HPr family phosphocarrier protein [Caproiciproducens faecalis]|uniref:Phosphocarrier protein HPr n=1 Tax=Caproiciproducens faecalis TaxID=2820301 RepID=A0ABS7DN80_9FIRM|nr:HPr family phosphocarrier protein [Caproiciproducens faecalis]MBW7572678.1 HPr family phosphocarrier protein [Caproiciproducens faecalis]